jgi:hypothetical protein
MKFRLQRKENLKPLERLVTSFVRAFRSKPVQTVESNGPRILSLYALSGELRGRWLTFRVSDTRRLLHSRRLAQPTDMESNCTPPRFRTLDQKISLLTELVI